MSKIRQILRLFDQGRSKEQIAEQTGISRNTLKKYLKQFTDSNLSFEEINALSDKDLEDLFVRPSEQTINEKLQTLFDLFPSLDKELKKKGMTRQLLWKQYKATHRWSGHLPVQALLRQEGADRAGDAILDRIVYSAHCLELKGEFLRKRRAVNTEANS